MDMDNSEHLSESERSLCNSIKLELQELLQFEVKSKPKRPRRKMTLNRKQRLWLCPKFLLSSLTSPSLNKFSFPIYCAGICKLRIPRKRFNAVHSNIIKGEPVITAPQQKESKRTCDRMILTELDCYHSPQDGVSPESTTRLIIEMRNALLKHDWITLAKLIILFTEVGRDKNRWFPTVLRVSSRVKLRSRCHSIDSIKIKTICLVLDFSIVYLH